MTLVKRRRNHFGAMSWNQTTLEIRRRALAILNRESPFRSDLESRIAAGRVRSKIVFVGKGKWATEPGDGYFHKMPANRDRRLLSIVDLPLATSPRNHQVA